MDDVFDEYVSFFFVKEGYNDMDNDVFYLSIYDTLKCCERGINSIYKVFFFRVIIFDYNDV